MWTRTVACEHLIQRRWVGGQSGSAGQKLKQCLSNTREGLISWERSHFGHVGRRVKQLEEQLQALDDDSTKPEDRLKRRALRYELEEFLSREELMWKQRGKAVTSVEFYT
ncbi:UNVERIFIED_CONTAM: hypothetical protein Slati_1160700 [Sesamum latifolium]|uniref:Uncharacterized protein n=1 Tax=Sesamum latifolium TaxID=2727402 RepID=A0AAW2XHW9_9LAMI